MKHAKIKAALLGVLLAAALGLSVYTVQTSPSDGQSSEPANPFPRPGTESETNTFEPEPYPTVSLSRLVEYYEGQLDPDIPKIEVTAHIYGDGFASVQKLPYDAYLLTGEEETEIDQNKTWFADLMNNIQSLPMLYDGYRFGEETPSRLTIRFAELPEGEIVIKDYGIFDKYGAAIAARALNTEVGYIHTFEAAQELSFDLWLYDGIHLMSTQPGLRGLLVECEIGGKQVEYYILFRTSYMGGLLPFYGEDLSHLTPLEGLEK